MNIFVRDMICYAAADVLALVRIILHLKMEIFFYFDIRLSWNIQTKCLKVPTIYTAMASQIKPEFGNLFNELCEEQVINRSDDDLHDEDVLGENFGHGNHDLGSM